MTISTRHEPDAAHDEQPKRTVGTPRPPESLLERLDTLNRFVRLLTPAPAEPEASEYRADDDFIRKTVGRPRPR